MADYYDRLLGAIAASLLGGAVVGVLAPVEFQAGLVLGALLATVFVYEALFRNPPRSSTPAEVAAGAVAWHLLVLGLVVVAV